ncbi:Mitogen-activated protein kinase kinase kinase [Bertholletia excelsa]
MDWTRDRTVGRGSSATVSVATHRLHGDIFAVKSAELSQSKFLQREQRILSTLKSPHIVAYIGHDVTEENNKLMCNLFMEYVPGGTLADEIRRHGGSLDQSEIVHYTHQIIQGLEYLHSVGVAHCDVKGQNILIGSSGAKIADFGCARWLSEAAPIGGTPAYMAPEVACGEEQGLAADIWALGCTVIEMATGCPPWGRVAGDPVSVLYRIGFSGEVPELPEFLSDQAKDFLGKCLKRDPRERWTAGELLKHPFLREPNSPAKQIVDFDSNSPTSILDRGVWSSTEESESDSTIQESYSNSPAERIGRLASCSGSPSWAGGKNWITIRGISDEARFTVEELIDSSDRNVSCSNKISDSFRACCTEHRNIFSSLCFDRDTEDSLDVQN